MLYRPSALLLLLLTLVLAACSSPSESETPGVESSASETVVPSAGLSVSRVPLPTLIITDAGCVVNPQLQLRQAQIETDSGVIELGVELATTADERQRGLMDRTELGEECGMLFVFEEDRTSGFWMKNTLIPLDIAYIDADARIVSIMRMIPCEEDPCPTYDPNDAYRYALEVSADSFEAWGVEVGDLFVLLP